MELGGHGEIGTGKATRGKVRAWVRYRDESGAMRMIERYAANKTEARRAVQKALDERQDAGTAGPGAVLRPTSTVADAWADYEREVLADKAASSQRVYRLAWAKHIEPVLGKLTVAQVTEARAESLVRKVALASGAGAAKTTRTVLMGVMERARKHKAVKVNVVKGSERPDEDRAREAKARREEQAREKANTEGRMVAVARDKDRMLTEAERAGLESLEGDAADLIAFMLGTGARLGEACAVEWDAVDLDAKTVHIGATIAKDAEGHSVRVERTKSSAGIRTVTISDRLVARLMARRVESTSALMFPAPRAGGVRELRATDREIRRVLDAQGLTWATSHTFRRTAATRLLSVFDPVQVAKHLGHTDPSLTMGKYGVRDEQAQARMGDAL